MALKVRKNKVVPPPQDCPLTECLSIIGGAWTPQIIWHLAEGPRRFSELQIDIPPVSPKMLTQRLKEMEENGVVRRSVKPTSPPSVEYSLTAHGQELVPAIKAIVDVGERLKQKRAKS